MTEFFETSFNVVDGDKVQSTHTGQIYAKMDTAIYAEPKCHTCKLHTRRNSYDQPEGFLRHNTKFWQEHNIAGVWVCPKCKKAMLMREGKAIKKLEKEGEDVSRFNKNVPQETRLTIGG